MAYMLTCRSPIGGVSEGFYDRFQVETPWIRIMAQAEHELMERLRQTTMRDSRRLMVVGGKELDRSAGKSDAKDLDFRMLEPDASSDPSVLRASRRFLAEQLVIAEDGTDDLPDDMSDLSAWATSSTAAVGERYREYLADRQAGAGRRYLRNKAHALNFLRGVAPTKLVDGAWLYGVVNQWRDARYAELIRIYLEELGDGDPEMNHVLLYKRLLAAHECESWRSLDSPFFTQGAIQLALAQHTEDLLPEVIGFNLGYEQLPLHLLVSAYELNELGIDPYYFTLHVTIDNAATGHSARAVRSVFDALPTFGDHEEFYRRVRNGYRLSSHGVSTNDVIDGFDLDQEVVKVLAEKASVGSSLHSDYCRIGGKTVNDWLSTPGQMGSFLQALEKAGWIQRHQNPENSRFWKLLCGEKAPMFGVFNAYDRQVIHDWIAGDTLPLSTPARYWYRNQKSVLGVGCRSRDAIGLEGETEQPSGVEVEGGTAAVGGRGKNNDFNRDVLRLQQKVNEAPSREAAMDRLVPLLSPTHHHTPAGLLATRLFAQALHE